MDAAVGSALLRRREEEQACQAADAAPAPAQATSQESRIADLERNVATLTQQMGTLMSAMESLSGNMQALQAGLAPLVAGAQADSAAGATPSAAAIYTQGTPRAAVQTIDMKESASAQPSSRAERQRSSKPAAEARAPLPAQANEPQPAAEVDGDDSSDFEASAAESSAHEAGDGQAAAGEAVEPEEGDAERDSEHGEEEEVDQEAEEEAVRQQLLAQGIPVRREAQVTLWTGTWNLGARDPLGRMKNPRQDLRYVEHQIGEFVPKGYDIYVLSVQEGVSDKLFSAIAAYTNTYRLPLYAKLFPAKENREVSAVRSRRMVRAVLVQDFIEQEEGGSKPEPSAQADMLDRVWGRGDGAFLRPKFTGMAVFVSRRAAPYVRLLGVYKHSFGASEGSKGGVGVALGVYNQTIAFIGAHMASKRTDMRRAQYEAIVEKLGAKLGGRGFQLTEEFHHVVWMGDLNYHCSGKGLTSEKAVHLLRTGRVAQLLEEHDELLAEREEGAVFYEFEEPTMTRDFLPTYKKIPGRGEVDYNDPEWPDRVYEYAFKEEWYKGGRTVDRIPSWTDRIMFHSLQSTDGLLQPEFFDPSDPDSGHNYRPVNDGLDLSDHSPVSCTWTLGIAVDEVPPSQLHALTALSLADDAALQGKPRGPQPSIDDIHATLRPLAIMLQVSNVRVTYRGRMRQPRAMSLLFPLPYEDGDEIPERAKVQRQAGAPQGPFGGDGLTGELTTLISRANKLPDLHLLLKVSLDDGTKPQASISLEECGIESTGSWKVTKFIPLMRNGLRAISQGPRAAPIDLQFTLEAHVQFASEDDIRAEQLRGSSSLVGAPAQVTPRAGAAAAAGGGAAGYAANEYEYEYDDDGDGEEEEEGDNSGEEEEEEGDNSGEEEEEADDVVEFDEFDEDDASSDDGA